MTDCDDVLDGLHEQTLAQVDLALLAEAPPVAAMQINLAAFSAEQTRVAEQLCDEG